MIGLALDVTSSASVDAASPTSANASAASTARQQRRHRQARHRRGDAEADGTAVAVHLDGTFRCSRSAHALLAASPAPAIVNTSSICAHVGLPMRLGYSAAKAGIEGLTRVLAVEWAGDGIRVNAVAPGYTKPAGWTESFRRPARSGPGTRLVPMKPLRGPTEIATRSLPRSDRASYITGQTLYVDGG